MKNLGKNINYTLLILSIFLQFAWAEVSVKSYVNKDILALGDSVMFTLEINSNGKDGTIPNLLKLGGYNIERTGQSTSLKRINGSVEQVQKFTYMITPLKTTTIQSINVSIDGVVYKTDPIKIEVRKNYKNKQLGFDLKIIPEKTDVYVGEPFKVILEYKQKRNVQVHEIKLVQPPGKDNFWIKEQAKEQNRIDGNYKIIQIPYIYAAQKSGELTISESQIKVATPAQKRDSWGMLFNSSNWNTLLSNSVKINAKDIPNGLKLIGDFNIDIKVDKTDVKPNEAVNYTINITGDGNVEDIKPFDFNLANGSVYSEKPDIQHHIEPQGYRGSFLQTQAIVATSSYTIPEINLHYFDPKDKIIKTLHADAININVEDRVSQTNNEKTTDISKKEEVVVEKLKTTANTQNINTPKILNQFDNIIAMIAIFVFGNLTGVLIFLLVTKKVWKRKQKDEKIKFKNNDKYILDKLLPFASKDQEIQKIVSILSENIYENKKHNIDYKEIKKLFDKIF